MRYCCWLYALSRTVALLDDIFYLHRGRRKAPPSKTLISANEPLCVFIADVRGSVAVRRCDANDWYSGLTKEEEERDVIVNVERKGRNSRSVGKDP